MNSARAGLYIHVPYCASLCSYCDFYRLESRSGVPGRYIEGLIAEAGQYSEGPRVRVDTVYFGGGTPSLLTPSQLARVLERAAEVFELDPKAEVTLEANPETILPGVPGAWLEAGVNRLSVGIQTFCETEIGVLGRRASPSAAESALLLAAEEGFRNISADLLGGIPTQGSESFEATLARASALPLQHVSFYILDLHGGTPLEGAVLRGEVALPREEETAKLYETAHERLSTAGFEHYEISNFAREGARCRHNLKYWRGGDYIGLGPSAHGRFRGWLTRNPRSIELWSGALERGEIPHESSEMVTPRMAAENALIFGIRLSEGVDLSILDELGEHAPEFHSAALQPLIEHGYAVAAGGRLKLTPRGFLLSNEILNYLLPGRLSG